MAENGTDDVNAHQKLYRSDPNIGVSDDAAQDRDLRAGRSHYNGRGGTNQNTDPRYCTDAAHVARDRHLADSPSSA